MLEEKSIDEGNEKNRQERIPEGLSSEERIEWLRARGIGWRDIFDNITYSAGPGENVYVWG